MHERLPCLILVVAWPFKIGKLITELNGFGSFCLYIGSWTMDVQKEGIS